MLHLEEVASDVGARQAALSNTQRNIIAGELDLSDSSAGQGPAKKLLDSIEGQSLAQVALWLIQEKVNGFAVGVEPDGQRLLDVQPGAPTPRPVGEQTSGEPTQTSANPSE